VWIRYDDAGELIPVLAGLNEDQLHDKGTTIHMVFPSLCVSELYALQPYLSVFRNLRHVSIGDTTYHINRSFPASRLRMTLAPDSPAQSRRPYEEAAA
jgi:hypothetical protein